MLKGCLSSTAKGTDIFRPCKTFPTQNRQSYRCFIVTFPTAPPSNVHPSAAATAEFSAVLRRSAPSGDLHQVVRALVRTYHETTQVDCEPCPSKKMPVAAMLKRSRKTLGSSGWQLRLNPVDFQWVQVKISWASRWTDHMPRVEQPSC